MTTATAEKPTCRQEIVNEYTYTECGKTVWTDTFKGYPYCPYCSKKIERVKKNEN